ncbi:MAG: spermidine dehydrogenase [Halieaceae bacterium]|jgi:spermidine dehydrogenase
MVRHPQLTRRDFLGGVALGTAAGALAPAQLFAQAKEAVPSVYPPALTGLRGSHPGAFDVAHAVAWQGQRYDRPKIQTDSIYDLVVVGGGISGLAAAFFWRQRMGPAAKILILDNHDDFGGHARRNEFTVDGKPLVGYGGSQSIDTPGSYSKAAAGLLRDVDIITERFYDYYDQDFFQRAGLGRGFYFSREAYGEDVTAPGFDLWRGGDSPLDTDVVARYPLGVAGRAGLVALMQSDRNHLAGLPRNQRIDWLRQHSYKDFLLHRAGAPEEVYFLLRDGMRGWWGVGWDAVSALEAVRMGMPGTSHLDLPAMPEDDEPAREEPYIFHFPDGNAGVARALVRKLIPHAIPGTSMEDLVLAKTDYSRLDEPGARCRLRLESTAVDVRHTADESAVDISYVRSGEVERVRGKHVVMACYNAIIPHICPELPTAQREAIGYAKKVPLVYVSIALRNWRPFADLGLRSVSIPKPAFMHSFGLDFPVSMGGVRYATDPDQPTILHGTFIPTAPDQGLSAREQHVLGRRAIYGMSFEDFEEHTRRQLEGALGAAGFDAARDMAALTINRWPHGYAYEYSELFDPPEYGRNAGPHLLGAQQIGRISIANSDASAYAFVDGAIDAASRAIDEQSS